MQIDLIAILDCVEEICEQPVKMRIEKTVKYSELLHKNVEFAKLTFEYKARTTRIVETTMVVPLNGEPERLNEMFEKTMQSIAREIK